MSKTLLGKLVLIFALAILPFLAIAQPPPLEDDPGQVPIDGGASFLVGAAVVYGAKKLKDRKKLKEK
jgi:hypothetical protein